MDEQRFTDTVRQYDGAGNGLPSGMNLSTIAHTNDLPLAELVIMSSIEELPDGLMISDGKTQVTVE